MKLCIKKSELEELARDVRCSPSQLDAAKAMFSAPGKCCFCKAVLGERRTIVTHLKGIYKLRECKGANMQFKCVCEKCTFAFQRVWRMMCDKRIAKKLQEETDARKLREEKANTIRQ